MAGEIKTNKAVSKLKSRGILITNKINIFQILKISIRQMSQTSTKTRAFGIK